MKLSEIALRVGARIENCAEDVEINGAGQLDEAEPGQIAYVMSAKQLAAVRTTRASALIMPNEFPAACVPMLRDDNPYLIYARVLELFYSPPQYGEGIHPTAVIHESAKIGPRPSIGPYAVIDQDVEVGANAVLLPHVVIYRGAQIGENFFAHAHAVVREYCRLGDNVILQNGAVIGADGFGFAKDRRDGRQTWKKIVHPGPAVLGDDVEVQTNASVERALAGGTRIGREVKIGDLAVVGHGASVGDHSMLSAQVGVAGEAKVGKHVFLLGKAGVIQHCRIGDGAIVTAQSGVVKDVDQGHVVSGSPAIENKRWLRSVAVFKRLPEVASQLHVFAGATRKKRTAAPSKGV